MMEIEETLAKYVDRISNLPDAILTDNILSLIPTRDSVRTSVLSTRWKNLYASVPVLDLQRFNRHGHSIPQPVFVSFVSKFLNTGTKSLSKFCIHNYSPFESSVILSWTETVISHSLQQLQVSVDLAESDVPTPHSLFTCESLLSLTLDINFVLSVPNSVILPNLKKLHMRNFVLSDESDDVSVMRLFSSCPVLERLSVFSWMIGSSKFFNLSVPSLKELDITVSKSTETEIIINCPNLEILRCQTYGTESYSGDVLWSLKKCGIGTDVNFEQFEEGKLLKLVNQVCKVQSLRLHGDIMEAIFDSLCSLPTFENLTYLELSAHTTEGWQMLPSILESSPRLETLVFPLGFFNWLGYHNGVPFSPPDHVPVCLSSHLKVVRINQFLGEEDEYKLVEYFLTNALILEKMVIFPWSSEEEEEEEEEAEGEGEGEMEVDEKEGEEEAGSEGEDQEDGEEEEYDQDLERHFEISKRLLNLQRFSEACQIILLESDNEEIN